MNKNSLPELLCPAGSKEALIAAVKGGADAVYVGGRMLNARMNAKNFDDQTLKECIEYCHNKGVKVHVTLNTAVYDKELNECVKYLDYLYSINVDAIIISDIGLINAIKDRYKGLELHASTQASGHNVECAKEFSKLGMKRMVCARELSENEITSICNESPIEIEQFIHGAMCVSQSGQCLASAMMGGRSGNRGICAQPCRMKYSCQSNLNTEYPLSLKDMCLANHIPNLIKSGVSSLKIEGRMKSPSYVYGVAKTYRLLLDEKRNASEKEMYYLKTLFSRDGFSDAYYLDEIGPNMLGVRSKDDISLSNKLNTDFIEIKRNLPPICYNREKINTEFLPPKPAKKPKKSGKAIYTARFFDNNQLSLLSESELSLFSHIYLPLEKYKPGKADGVILPPAIFPNEWEDFVNKLQKAYDNGARHAYITSIGQIEVAKKIGYNLHGDYRLNIFNTLSCDFYKEKGLSDVMLSPELTIPQMRDIQASKVAIVYGKIPIMTLTKPVGVKKLTDQKTNTDFDIIHEFGLDILLNSVPFYMADKQNILDDNFIRGRHLIFTTESPKECFEIINAFKNNKPTAKKIRRIGS